MNDVKKEENNMAIKLIATDLDGTFYHRDRSYDKQRFLRLYDMMKQQGIHFVVASGNQYFSLKSHFPEIEEEITYVAENGALIVDQGKELFSVSIPSDTCDSIIQILEEKQDVLTLVCGKESAYVLDTIPQEEFEFYLHYFPKMKKIKCYDEINDQILKFALVASTNFENVVKELMEVVDESMSVVTSGHEDIDLIVKGVHKGNAITMLMNQWNVQEDEVMAFGDAENDREMLKLAKYGFVMENGSESMKKEFDKHAPHHEQDGMLEIVEQYLTNPEEFYRRWGK